MAKNDDESRQLLLLDGWAAVLPAQARDPAAAILQTTKEDDRRVPMVKLLRMHNLQDWQFHLHGSNDLVG